ncbi:hypothetical protein LPMST01_12205 [Salmonella enterica subsp. enterica serovar Infantis]|nr:hypothetical protein LPMST01_12205 [Salmonella enterica subsp. enterica serovar Infantis]
MNGFDCLKFLSIPIDAIGYIDIDSISSHLEHLHITSPRSDEFYGFYEKESNSVIFDAVFPQLRTLGLLASPIVFKNFDVHNYPALEYLRCELEFDKSAKFLKIFNNSVSMQGYGLDVVSKKDLLKNIPRNVRLLKFWSITTRQFNFSLLEQLPELRYLEIAGSYTPIDCSSFSKLPELIELNIRDSKEIYNTEMLLMSVSLNKVGLKSIDKHDVNETLLDRMKSNINEVECNLRM